MVGPHDSVVATYRMIATSSANGWKVMLPNRPVLPLRVVTASGDSVVTELGPFASILRQGQTVITRTTWHLRGDQLTGRILAVFSSGAPLEETATAVRTDSLKRRR